MFNYFVDKIYIVLYEKIVKGNDFTMKIPVSKYDGE